MRGRDRRAKGGDVLNDREERSRRTSTNTLQKLAPQPLVSNNTCSRLLSSLQLSLSLRLSLHFNLLHSPTRLLSYSVLSLSHQRWFIHSDYWPRQSESSGENKRKGGGGKRERERIEAGYGSLLISQRDARTTSSTKCLPELNRSWTY